MTCHDVLSVIPVPCEHQGADQRDQVEHEEEKERRREQREELLFQFRGKCAHGEGDLLVQVLLRVVGSQGSGRL